MRVDNNTNVNFWNNLLLKEYEAEKERQVEAELKRLEGMGRGKRERKIRNDYYESTWDTKDVGGGKNSSSKQSSNTGNVLMVPRKYDLLTVNDKYLQVEQIDKTAMDDKAVENKFNVSGASLEDLNNTLEELIIEDPNEEEDNQKMEELLRIYS